MGKLRQCNFTCRFHTLLAAGVRDVVAVAVGCLAMASEMLFLGCLWANSWTSGGC